MSRRVDELERWLGAPIFERHGRGVRLTAVGSKIASRVERSMSAITALARDIRAERHPEAVRISVLPSFARLWLVRSIRRLEGTPVDLDLRIVTEHRVVSLEARETDLAIRIGRGDWAGTLAKRIFDETLWPVAHPSIAQTVTDVSHLLAKPLLHDGNSDDWRRWFATAGVAYRPTDGERRFDDYDLVLAAARTGAGVALARMPMANLVVAEAGLVRLPGPEMSVNRSHWLVMRPSESRPPVLRATERILAIGAEAER